MEDEVKNPFSVLVMESDQPALSSLSRMVCLADYRAVATARKASNGLELSRGFDIIMVSVDMKDMNGLDFLEILSKEMLQLPVIIVMASEENKDDMFRARYLGACDYIVKPVKEDYVQRMWQHALRMRNGNLVKEQKPLALPPKYEIGGLSNDMASKLHL